MLIESSCIPKSRNCSQPGDDVLAVIPHHIYAVFDGATDTVGAHINGVSPGLFAASQAASAMVTCATGPNRGVLSTQQWLTRMNEAIAVGLLNSGATSIRASTTAAVVEDAGDNFRFLIVGDSSIRINGTELFRLTKDIDLLYTAGRVALFNYLQSNGLRGDELEQVTRQFIFKGLAQEGHTLLPQSAIESILSTAQQECDKLLQPDAVGLVAPSLLAGIAGGQYGFCNLAGHSLGYAVINGSHTAGPDILTFSRSKSEVQSIELFTDGYLSCPAGTRVQDWEDEFFRVELEDFSKTSAHRGVKGSSTQFFSDDRAVITINFNFDH